MGRLLVDLLCHADGSHGHPITRSFYIRTGNNFQLYLIRPSGTGRHAIPHTPDNLNTINESPDWQPH